MQEEKQRTVTLDKRGGHTSERFRYKTTKAMIVIQFRRGKVSKADILAALDEARSQAVMEDRQS